VVDGHTTIGANAKLFPFCTVGLAPQDWKYKDEPTRCEVGDRVLIREHCTIHRGTVSGRGVTSVGNECMLMAVVHVAHDCILGNNVVVANNFGFKEAEFFKIEDAAEKVAPKVSFN